MGGATMRIDEGIIIEILERIHRNYPMWPSTFGPCVNGCDIMARGSGECVECLVASLTRCVGIDLAKAYQGKLEDLLKVRDMIFEQLANSKGNDT